MTCEAVKKHKEARKCRFCDSEIKGKQSNRILSDVCTKKDCVKLKELSCVKRLECGHSCKGFKGEENCLPCLSPECEKQSSKYLLADTNEDTYCSICWVGGLGSEPCV